MNVLVVPQIEQAHAALSLPLITTLWGLRNTNEEGIRTQSTNDLAVSLYFSFPSISRPPFKGSTSQSSAQSASRKVTNSPSFWSEEWEEGPPRVEEISLLFFFFFLSLQLLSQEVHNTVEILNLGHSSQRTKKEEMDLELKSVQKRAEKRSLRNGSHIIVYELMVSCLRSMCMDLSL